MKNNQISYVEFKAYDLEVIKKFYSEVFGWEFKDYGSDYVSFSNSGLKGGFEKTDGEVKKGAIIVLYHENLEEIKEKVIDFGEEISKDIFSFPGGSRFHFIDPAGNELGVWSDK